MRKALLIIQREYWTRVKKKSFLLITFITPFLLALAVIAPGLLVLITSESETVHVKDESGYFDNDLKNSKDIHYAFIQDGSSETVDSLINQGELVLKIPEFELSEPTGFELMAKKNPSLSVRNEIESTLEEKIRTLKIRESGIDEAALSALETNINVKSSIIGAEGKSQAGSTAAASVASLAGGFLIYFFIFLYGGQVTTGVHEEKSSRIVEILISSVKPVQLMFGKIVGIALVGLTQFVLWVFLTIALAFGALLLMGPSALQSVSEAGSNPAMAQEAAANQEMVMQAMSSLSAINFPLLVFSFLFYFLFGYLTYSSLFAGVAAAIDNQTDMRQFITVLAIPLLLAIIITPSVVIKNPDSMVAIIGSLIPFTSPVIMMARLPFGVPVWQILLSFGLMLLGFWLTVWIAAKVYRTGILLYGKKITAKDLLKWMVKG